MLTDKQKAFIEAYRKHGWIGEGARMYCDPIKASLTLREYLECLKAMGI